MDSIPRRPLGGSNQIVDADVSSLDIKAADVASGITLGQQLANFLANSAVTTGNYQATVNALRTGMGRPSGGEHVKSGGEVGGMALDHQRTDLP